MRIYHGTDGKKIPDILREGIRPRGKKKGNWSRTVTSNPECVYLTTAYAPYFALVACDDAHQLGVVEVETDRLDEDLFLPDEDFLEQATRRFEGDSKGQTMIDRTLWYRRHAWNYQHTWNLSIKHMGTCCYAGVIPPSAIRKAIVLDGLKRDDLLAEVMDPTITLIHYKILGKRYETVVQWLMGREVDVKLISSFGELMDLDEEMKSPLEQLHKLQQEALAETYANRDGITTLYEEGEGR